jgi:hypothetical protein
MSEPGLEFVTRRSVVSGPIEIRFPLRPGDRALVAPGDVLVPGSRIADRLREARLVEVRGAPVAEGSRPGDRWTHAAPAAAGVGGSHEESAGELLFELGGHWRMAAGEHSEEIDTPVGGVVHDVRPGIGIGVRAVGRVIRGVEALGEPSRGVLAINPEPADGAGPGTRLKAGSLDVGLAGAILVVGSRVDAETLTRARAMGLRGIIVAGLAGKERRDFLASEARQKASLHRLPTFAVLVLDGAVRRPIASPVASALASIAGREVAIVMDPPALLFDENDVDLAPPPPDLVRIRTGERAGREGRWAGLAGLRRFAGGTFLEAGWIVYDGGLPVAVPLGDLERFA